MQVVRPFLVGFLENEQIEVKHLIAPQVITQRIELISSSICSPHAVSINSSSLKVLDSMFLVLADSKELKTRVLVKLQQCIPHEQILSLVKVKMFNTVTSFCDMLLENGFD